MIAVTLPSSETRSPRMQPVAERARLHTRRGRRVERVGHQRADLDATGVLGAGLRQRRRRRWRS